MIIKSVNQQLKDLEERIAYQEFLHRYVDEDGNVSHSMSILPYVIAGFVVGGLFVYLLIIMLEKSKKPLALLL